MKNRNQNEIIYAARKVIDAAERCIRNSSEGDFTFWVEKNDFQILKEALKEWRKL